MLTNQNSSVNECLICGSSQLDIFLELQGLPVLCHLLFPSQSGAVQTPRGEMRLGFCQNCGHIFNLNFEPDLIEYTQDYDNTLDFSPTFKSYAESLADHLLERFNLYKKTIIEIGCGKGDFLKRLCKLGENRGIGFDVSYSPDLSEINLDSEKIEFIQDYYSERYAHYEADFICCRQVLEHIKFPVDFLRTIRSTIGDRLTTDVFFEVPNALFALPDEGVWDIIYEHISYFSRSSLDRLFKICQFETRDLYEKYGEQFLCIEAVPRGGSSPVSSYYQDDIEAMAQKVKNYSDVFNNYIVVWKDKISELAKKYDRIAMWGAGSKGVSFLNRLGIKDQVKFVVDINPRKQGNYIVGTGHKIVSPDFLREFRPEVILIMNPIYKDEIQEIVASFNLNPLFVCL